MKVSYSKQKMKLMHRLCQKIKRRKIECWYRLNRLRRCGFRGAIVIVLCIWIIILMFRIRFESTAQTGEEHTTEGTFRQADLDYFAQNIQLNFSVVENTFDGGLLYRARIVLTNNGNRRFPWRDWYIVFCQPYPMEPKQYPFPDGVAVPGSDVTIVHLNARVYRLDPIANASEGIAPGRNKDIEYIGLYYNIAITDNFPNWYFAVEGLEPRIIESTRGESFDWVGKYDSPNLWKRRSSPNDVNYDYYDPLTPEERFVLHGVPDMKKAPLPVIPVPTDMRTYDPSSTVNVLTGNWVIVTPLTLENEADYLSDVWGLRVVSQAPLQRYISFLEEEVTVTLDGKDLPTDESYELSVSPSRDIITIKASKPAGAFYAVQTLMSISDAQGNIPRTVIRDAPRYQYRGIMLDVARNFLSKEAIFRYIDLMAMYKLNKLHFHLTDDEGWRLAIPGLPELTKIGATRCHDPTGTRCLLPFLGSGPFAEPPGSGFYSVEDYRAILRYAALHHVEVIPEMDMPGHSHAAIRAMGERRKALIQRGFNISEASRFLLHDLQDESKYFSVQGFHDNAMNPCLQSTYTFITRIINTLYSMHRDVNPLKVFHFGGDEVPKGTWQESPMCQRLKDTGVNIPLADYLALQIANMTSMYNLDLAGWEDGLWSSLNGGPLKRDTMKNENVYSYTWNNAWGSQTTRKAYDFANNGYKVVITPATNLYFDHPQEPDPSERGLYWASRYTDTFQVYTIFPENLYWNANIRTNGAPRKICANANDCPKLVKKDNIAGIQGTLFGELLRTQAVTDHLLLPRLLALAERAWHKTTWENESDKEKREKALAIDWAAFTNTLGYKELARLDRMGFEYRLPPPGAKLDGDRLTTSTQFPGLPVEISQDGGQTWTDVISNTATLQPGKPCLLRTRAASGTRYSRPVLISRDDRSNSYHSKGASFLIFSMILLALQYCFV